MKKLLLIFLLGIFMGVAGFSQNNLDIKPVQKESHINKKMPPTFQGGDIEDFRIYIQRNVKYPEEAVKEGVSGTVYVKFNVTRRGKVIKVEIIRSVESCLDNAVVDVVKRSPDWDHRRGRTFTFVIPVNFILK
jgi:protein TonB